MKHANPDSTYGNKDDAMWVNRARDCLKDASARVKYNASVSAAGSSDGQSKDPNWEETLKNRSKPGLMEIR